MIKYGISREEERKLPEFKSHDEAREYFKNKYGDNFQLVDSDIIDDEKLYFYKLILNKEAYEETLREIEENGFAKMTEEKLFATQDIQIFESGHIHIVH